MPSAEQMVRVVALAQALTSSRRGVVLKHFAADRGWPIRYVHRDLKTLEGAGFPIEGEKGRYRLPADWAVQAHAELDAEELVALFVARQLAGSMRGTGVARALDRLWSKLGARDGQARIVPDSAGSVAVRPAFAIDYDAHRAHIACIERAIERREALDCRYRRPRTGAITRRIIEPGELYVDPGLESMYCIAWCRLRQAVRVFAVHRFLEVRATGEGVPVRPETRSRNALQRAFRIWRSEAVERVRLEFAPCLASEILERRWHPSQVTEPTSQGGVILTMEVAEPRELERWLLGFGPDVAILEPSWLSELVHKAHRAASATRIAPARPLPAESPGRSSRRRSRA